jgi:hypothetical protein
MTQRTAVEELQQRIARLRKDAAEEVQNAESQRAWAAEADARAAAALSLAGQYEDILGAVL